MARKTEPAIKRDAMFSWRTTTAGARHIKQWCKRRRLDVSEMTRQAVIEYMQRHDKDIPEVTSD